MSSSKYKENARGFQRENLVKEVDHQAPWEPSPQRPSSGFHKEIPPPQTLPPPQRGGIFPAPPLQDTGMPQVPPPGEIPLPMPGQASSIPPLDPALESSQAMQSKEMAPPMQAPPSQPAVDMSQYIEITDAEAQIESAYKEGIKAGIQQAEEDYGSATRSMVNACGQLDTLQKTILENSSKNLKELAIAIADRILRLSVTEQDKTIIATIEEALHRAIRSEEFTIYVNPEDYDIVLAQSPDIIAGLSGLENILVKTDKSVERGGARMESENCTIDATIASQFEMIREEILKETAG